MKSKTEDILFYQDNKQRCIRMLGQSLEHVGCETRHAKGAAYVLFVDTTVQSAMSCETTLVALIRICLCFCVFMSRKILVKSSSNQRSGVVFMSGGITYDGHISEPGITELKVRSSEKWYSRVR